MFRMKSGHVHLLKESQRCYIPDIFVHDETGSVSIYCAKTMLATHEGVGVAQSELNEICVPFAAGCDGWITAGNRQDH